MRTLQLVLFTLLLSGCAQQVHTTKSPLADGNRLPSTSAINHVSQQIANELVRQNDALRANQPLLVATPVLLADLNQTNAVGLQLQEGLTAAMHEHQFSLVDINVGENIRVTPQGDFLLTRNWKQLPTDIAVEHVLVSTMSMSSEGMVINARVVNITNNRVVSASQASFGLEQLPGYLRASEQVVSQDGLLYRDSGMGEKEVRVIGGLK
ncbi:FlgO family outer membrane protein [Shewanella woodyi]|uniref:FlgO family outer membrane protein n=1 Tax=Shewanella woodyi TaxID=60961 RepID=UPI0037488364